MVKLKMFVVALFVAIVDAIAIGQFSDLPSLNGGPD